LAIPKVSPPVSVAEIVFVFAVVTVFDETLASLCVF